VAAHLLAINEAKLQVSACLRSTMDDATSTNDARALAAVREGEEAAFLVLVARYHCAMVELAETFVDNRAIAEQVAREAWLDVLARAGTFPGCLSVRCWMFQILIERARLRGAQVQSPQAWPHQELDTASARERALSALRSLPPFQRRVMLLRDVEGWTAAEVCETMQLSALEQRACLHRARTAVRASLGGSPG